MTFVFPDYDTLRLAITSGFVPTAVSFAPARSGCSADGGPWLSVGPAPAPTLQQDLRRLGVQSQSDEPPGGGDVAHWLQAFPLHRDAAPPALTDQTAVLFELAGTDELAVLASEILRLGNDRQAYRWLQPAPDAAGTPMVLLRVVGPPYYSLLRALDRPGPETIRAYVERSPRVWVALGYSHPLAELIRAPERQAVLLWPPNEWVYVDDAPFHDIYDVLDFALTDSPRAWADAPPSGKLTVPLQLAPAAATDAAELWVLDGNGLSQIDTLVRDADDKLLARLAFAVGELDGRRVSVLRARPSKEGPPVLALDALACRSYLRLPNLFLPLRSRLDPPLRREAVRNLLANDPAQVTWLLPTDGDFTSQSLPDEAFRPLGDWVDYIIGCAGDRLSKWAQAAAFDFESFVSKEPLVPANAPAVRPRPSRPISLPEALPDRSGAAPRAATPVRKPDDVPLPAAESFTGRPVATPTVLQKALKDVEQRFLAVEGSLDAPARQALWPELARLNAALGQTIDAAASWVNALWEPAEPSTDWTWHWARTEKALVQPELTVADVDRFLAQRQPTTPDVRPFAAAIVWGAAQKSPPAALRQRLAAILQYLEKHDYLLPVRAAWLAAVGLTRVAGADVLALVRARDRLLERLLAEGLSPERDLASFLRYAGQRDADRLRLVRERAEQLRQLAQAWFPLAVTQIGRYDQTPAYIDLMFAFGLARLHETTASRALLSSAATVLGATEGETHSVLLQAFQFRIEQVLSGRPHAGALPSTLIEYVDHLRTEYEKQAADNSNPNRWIAYIVDRLREQSRILEPQETFKPYRYTDRASGDDLSKDMATWPDMIDPRQLRARIERWLGPGVKKPPTSIERVHVLSQAIPLAHRVGEEFCLTLIHAVPATIESVTSRGPPDAATLEPLAKTLERAILFAAHYDDREFVTGALDRLSKLLDASSGPAALQATASLVGQSLRGLRKFGMRDEAERLLARVQQWVFRGKSLERLKNQAWPQTLEMLLRLAAGWLDFDRADQARPVLDEARAYLLQGATGLTGTDAVNYVSIASSYISALGHGQVEEALGRVEELLAPGRTGKFWNTFTTQTHYSRFHLNIVEAIVLALASEEFALGPDARRWLDDDEYLVRRRIHRDVRMALKHAGMD